MLGMQLINGSVSFQLLSLQMDSIFSLIANSASRSNLKQLKKDGTTQQTYRITSTKP